MTAPTKYEVLLAANFCNSAGQNLSFAWASDLDFWAEYAMDNLHSAAKALGYTLTPIAAEPPAPAVTMVAEDDRPATFATTTEGAR